MISTPPDPRRRRGPLVALVLAGVLVVAGVGAFLLGRESKPSSTAAHIVRLILPVIRCPTTYGLAQTPTQRVPDRIVANLPVSVAADVSFYSDSARSLTPILAPKGWQCSAGIGADGSFGITVYPRGRPDPETSSANTLAASTEVVEANKQGPSANLAALTACHVFRYTVHVLATGGTRAPACSRRYARQRDVFVSGSASAQSGIALFTDPPHVKGTGTPSGGAYPAIGALRYSARVPAAEEITCVLPPSLAAVCRAATANFLTSKWGFTTTTNAVPRTSTLLPSTTTTSTTGTQTVTFSDRTGDLLKVTLEKVVNPDQADLNVGNCFGPPASTSVPVAVVIRFVNAGSTVLVTGGPGDGLTLVDSSGTPFSFPSAGCMDTSTDAAPECTSSTNAIDLAPGDSAVWCPVIEVPAGEKLTEVQFDASTAFGLSGRDTVALWRLP